MSGADDGTRLSPSYVRFIDILYVVTLGRAFLTISETLNFPARLLSTELASLPFMLFAFSFVIVGRDWVDYHVGISARPHKHWCRFLLDVVILFFFFQLTRSYQEPSTFFGVLAGYFSVVFLWTVVEGFEYRDKDHKEHKHDLVWNVGYVVVAVVLAVVANFWSGVTLKVAVVIGFLAAGWLRRRMSA